MTKWNKFMEFKNFKLTQGAADAYTTVAVKLPTSKTEKMALLVHKIEFSFAMMELVADRKCSCQLTHNQQTELIMGSNDLIIRRDINTDLNTNGMAVLKANIVEVYNPPRLIADDEIWFAIDTTTFTNAITMDCSIGYTLERVTQEQFISALVRD